MEKLKTSDFIVLTKKLSAAEEENDGVSLSEALGRNIYDVFVTIVKKPQYSALFELMKETKPLLLSNTQQLPNIPDQKLVAIFVEWNLYLLEQYSLALTKEMRYYKVRSKSTAHGKPPPDQLSDIDKKSIFNCIDFVVVFGILMHLSEGVGDEEQYPILKEISKEKHCNIKIFLNSLCLMIDFHSLTLSSIFRDYINVAHFNALFAGLFEIVYNPAFRKQNLEKNNEGEPFADNLMNLIHIMDPKFIFRQLLHLLKCSEITCNPKTHVPDWLSEACSNTICKCLLKENGLEDYILVFNKSPQNATTQSTSNKAFSIDWQQCDYVCHTITHLPFTCMEKSDFFTKICTQIIIILKLLYNPDDNDETLMGCPTLVPILVRIMSFIFEEYPKIFVEKVLSVLASPLHLIAFPGIVRSSDWQKNYEMEVVDEQSLTICLELLYELLVIFHFTNSKLSTCLLPHVHILYTISLHLKDTNSFLRPSVEELIYRIMNDMDTKEAVALVKRIIGFKHLNVLDDPDKDSTQKVSEFMKVDSSLSFRVSPIGGLIVVKGKPEKAILKENSLPVILKKCSSVVELLSKLSNKHIIVKIFMDCLLALTKVVSDELTESKLIRTVAVKELKIGSTEWADNISLLTLLDALINQCHEVTQANFDRLIIFCKAVMEMNILLLENSIRCSLHENLLNFAATVVNTLIDKAHRIKNSQWEQAFLMLPNLKRLATSYPLPAIRKQCVQALKQLTSQQAILMTNTAKNVEEEDAQNPHMKKNNPQHVSDMSVKNSELENIRIRKNFTKQVSQEMKNKTKFEKNVLSGFDDESQLNYKMDCKGSVEVLVTKGEIEDAEETNSSSISRNSYVGKNNQQDLSDMSIKDLESKNRKTIRKYLKKQMSQEMKNKTKFEKNMSSGFYEESQSSYKRDCRDSVEVLVTRGEIEDFEEKTNNSSSKSLSYKSKKTKMKGHSDISDSFIAKFLAKSSSKQSLSKSSQNVGDKVEDDKASYEDTLEGSKKMLKNLEIKLKKQQATKKKELEQITLQEIKLQRKKIGVLERSETIKEIVSNNQNNDRKNIFFIKSVHWSDGDRLYK